MLYITYVYRAAKKLKGHRNIYLSDIQYHILPLLLEKWFPLKGERAHSLKLFCMYDKRFEISKTK